MLRPRLTAVVPAFPAPGVKKVRGPGRVTDFQKLDCGFRRFLLKQFSAETGGRIRSLRMTGRTILFSGNQDQSQNHVNHQDAVESERTSHGRPPLSFLSLYLPEDRSATKKLTVPLILDGFTNIYK